MKDWDHSVPREVDWVIGAAMMVRREAIAHEAFILDERFFLYFEDVDLCRSLRIRNWSVFYVPSSVMVHHHQRSSATGFISMAKLHHLKSWIKFEMKYHFD